ncbi:MAG: hypothetical protein Q9183_003441, partial [Haloplaca sp. 2 TL-2023]
MFKEDGNVIHFAAPKGISSLSPSSPYATIFTFSDHNSRTPHVPIITADDGSKVHASIASNTFAVYGNGEDKELTELVPGILNQLGPDSLASLRKLAESYQ